MLRADCYSVGVGNAAGLRMPVRSTARTPKNTLSFDRLIRAPVRPADVDHVGPVVLDRRPPHHLVGARSASGLASQVSSVSLVSSAVEHLHVLRGARRVGQRPQRRGVHPGHPRDVVEVAELAAGRRTARRSRRARPGAGGRSSRCGSVNRAAGKPLLEERDVVAAAQVAVAAVDHPHAHAGRRGCRRPRSRTAPSCRAGESFSPPTDWRMAASASVSAVGTPSANSRRLRRVAARRRRRSSCRRCRW